MMFKEIYKVEFAETLNKIIYFFKNYPQLDDLDDSKNKLKFG